MMHPFANVAGLFEDPLMSWQGQFGDLIESLEFYETDEQRGFVRGARWGLAPTGGPINTALPSRAGEQVWGPDHHAHVRTHLGHGANWGLFAEDLPDEANHITLSSTVTDSSGIPAPEVHYRMSDNSRRMLDFHIERAKESMDAAGAYKIEVDRLMRYSGWHLLGTARMGDDPKTSVLDRWNRAHDVPNLYVVDGSCFVTSSGVNPTSTIVAIALRAADHMVETRFEQQVPADEHRRPADPLASLDAGERGDARRGRRPAHPGRPRHAVGGRGRDRRRGCGSSSTPGRTCSSRSARRSGRSSATTSQARLDTLGRDEPASARRAAARHRRRLLHRHARPGADRLSRPDGARAPLVGVPRLSRGRPDRRRARPRAGLARPGDRAAGRRDRCAADLRGALRRPRPSPEGGHDGHDRP